MIARNGIAALRGTLVVLAATLIVFGTLVVAGAEPANPALGLAPHVATESETDTCAMCHRGHTSASSATWRAPSDSATVNAALLTGVDSYDVGLCYVCHGIDALGSAIDVQTPFVDASHHVIAPDTSAYGPSPKQCSDCHDSHGAARVTTGTPYPALLRSFDSSGTAAYQGDVYCANCHPDRPADMWDGLAVWNQTAHAQKLPATSPTLIVCLDCHESHGSPIPPLLRAELLPPSAPDTATVLANDRTFCIICHPTPAATWDGPTEYALSSHGSSTATAVIEGEWPGAGASRLAGECQNCHAPMGADDGTGQAVPKLGAALGSTLCYRCHTASGPAKTNLAALAYPATATTDPELISAYGASAGLARYGRVALYTRETSGAAPLPLIGPREYRPSSAVGTMTAGDVNGDGRAEVVVADPSTARLDVLEYDPLHGLSDRVGLGVVAIGTVADFVGVGDVIIDGSGLPEVVVVNRAAGALYVYRYNGSGLSRVQGPVAVGAITGMAVGNFQRTAAADVALTRATNQLVVYSESGGQLTNTLTVATLAGPCAPSTGDAWPGGELEIVVCNAGETTNTVSVFRGSTGALLGSFAGAGTGLRPTASAIGNVLPGVTPAGSSGMEVLVTYSDPTGSSRLDVYPQGTTQTGLAAPTAYTIGTRFNPTWIAVGDVDGDARIEAAIANAGSFSRDAARREASTQIWRADTAGTVLDTPVTLWASGAETAGGATTVAIADVGGVGPTRHPVSAVSPRTHVSTETVTVPRHVECVDCHDVHEANAATTTAPAANGRIAGTWGVTVTNQPAGAYDLALQQNVAYEYELCLKCHSPWTALAGDPDIAQQVNTLNPSVHAVEATSTTSQATDGSFVGSWSNSSVLYCTDCHGNSVVAEPVGPHRSKDSPLLKGAYAGVPTSDSSMLCYECHNNAVYFTGAEDGVPASTSLFYDADLGAPKSALHSYHTNVLGFGCASCHVSHGSVTEAHLIRSDINYAQTASGGACANACHTGGASHGYARP